MLIKVLLNFLLPIPLDGKRGRNRVTFGKKASFEAALLIFPLHNSSKNAFLFLLLYSLIILSSFCLSATKLGISVFGKDNIRKSKGDDPRSTSTDKDRRIRVDDPGTETEVDVGVDHPGTVTDNPGIKADNPGTATNNSGITTDNPNIAVDDPSREKDINVEADNPGTVVSNKACAASFFALCYTLFLLAFSSELVTTFLPAFLSFLYSTTLRLKAILSCSVTLVKQKAPCSIYPIDKIWTPSFNKLLLGMSAMVRLL